MKKLLAFTLIMSFFCLAAQGCSSRAWYEGLQEVQRRDCYKLQSQAEIQDCLDRVNAGAYDRYQKEREIPDEQPLDIEPDKPKKEAGEETPPPVMQGIKPIRGMGNGYRRGY